ncbi:sialate O-acetylesterase [Halosimplex rubrum]|uniref:sialate O-acetylesterase n=1 Tax=Halosimplex rubrum TaxID=869889 RepID=UPI001C54E089|nr:sialate O-acetylesterase [Halosimplex rubrum]
MTANDPTHDTEESQNRPDQAPARTAADDQRADRSSALSRRGVLKTGAALGTGALAVGLGAQASATTPTDPSNLDLYLLFGQSNMEGQGTIEPQDRETNDRIHVLADLDCPNLEREYGEWYRAEPPLNRCYGNLGPGDYFAKTMIDEVPEDRGIGLVPAAVSGADIKLFQKGAPIGRNGRDIPSQFDGAYQWMRDLAETAQEAGTFKGILFHQGETDTADQQWTGDVQGIVQNLRSDLGIGTVPFLAGEMLYDSQGGCCGAHNSEVNELPDVIANAHVVSAQGLEGQDNAHFTAEAYRELGRRYAEEMLRHVDPGGGPATGTPTPTDEPETPTPTDEPETPTSTDEPETPTSTDEPETPTPTDTPAADAMVVDDYDGDPGWSSHRNDLGQWCGAGSFANGGGEVVDGALVLEYDNGGWFQTQINQSVEEYSTLVFEVSGADGGEESEVLFDMGGVRTLLSNVTDDSVGTSTSEVRVDLASAGIDRSVGDLSVRLNFWQGGSSVLAIGEIRLE